MRDKTAGIQNVYSDRDVLLDKSPRQSQCEVFSRVESCDMWSIEEVAAEDCTRRIDPQYMPSVLRYFQNLMPLDADLSLPKNRLVR
ncbi:hypothetical protein KIN20_027900 [Parelaphostrongylus tenuis]|uniref:Uncharacterized protein n=1 Tax=Parelaphostrongylus tenuis TaxID=148309 RepID=A0AAD5WEC3_PARTN|nr:hypothetical protein KIN20_027900 [Parelaphostrongylus tenuis]